MQYLQCEGSSLENGSARGHPLGRRPERGNANTLWAGARDVAPFAAVIGVLGILLGYLSTRAGMTPLAAITLSATTFSGSAQFAAASLLRDGSTVGSAVLAAAFIASRHIPMGAALAPNLSTGPWRRALIAQLAVDESWAVAYLGGTLSTARLVGAGIVIYVVHVTTTAIGAVCGAIVDDPLQWGLDAAFPALFVLLLWPRLGDRNGRLTIALAAFIAFVLIPWLPRGVVVVAAAAAAFAHARPAGRDSQ